jgi:hypothetical protein
MFSETKSERSKQIIDSESTRRELSKNAIIFEKFRWASNLEIRPLERYVICGCPLRGTCPKKHAEHKNFNYN